MSRRGPVGIVVSCAHPGRFPMTNLTMVVVSAGLLVAIPLYVEAGRWLGRRRRRTDESSDKSTAAVSATVFALLGLLIAFAFSGASGRFDARRQLIVEEANAIGTAWLRLDVLPAERQPALRDQFRRYVDLRIAVYRQLPDVTAAFAELGRANALQSEIWTAAVAASRGADNPAVMML